MTNQKKKISKISALCGKKRVYERAPEPSDLFWENIGLDPFRRMLRVAATFLCTVALVVGCFFAIYALNLVKRDL